MAENKMAGPTLLGSGSVSLHGTSSSSTADAILDFYTKHRKNQSTIWRNHRVQTVQITGCKEYTSQRVQITSGGVVDGPRSGG